MSLRRSLPLIIAVAVTILFWGSAFAGIRAGLQGYSPAHLAVLRFIVASGVLVAVALKRRMRLPAREHLPMIFLLGLVGFAYYNLALNIGEQSIASGPAALLIQTAPIWTALLAVAFLDERLRGFGWLGIAVSFAGGIVIALGSSSGFQFSWGALLVISAAISTSVYNILQKHMLVRYQPLEMTCYALWAGTILLLPFAPGLVGQMQAAPLSATLAVIYLGVCPAAIGYLMWSYILSWLPASRAASFLYAVPVMAFVVAWGWLGETPTPVHVIGGTLALSGVVIVNTLGRARADTKSTASLPLAAESNPD